jgi:hypothetical protein
MFQGKADDREGSVDVGGEVTYMLFFDGIQGLSSLMSELRPYCPLDAASSCKIV